MRNTAAASLTLTSAAASSAATPAPLATGFCLLARAVAGVVASLLRTTSLVVALIAVVDRMLVADRAVA